MYWFPERGNLEKWEANGMVTDERNSETFVSEDWRDAIWNACDGVLV